MRGRRLRMRGEAGTSLIEVMISIILLVALGPLVGSVMVSTLQAGQASENQSRVVDELRQQMFAITRELRSASCITTPTAYNTPGDTLRFTTESQTGSLASTSDLRYQIQNSGGQSYLVRTSYDTSGAEIGSRLVGPGLVSPNTTFELRSTPRKSVIIQLRLQLSTDRPVQSLTTTIAGRNAWLTC